MSNKEPMNGRIMMDEHDHAVMEAIHNRVETLLKMAFRAHKWIYEIERRPECTKEVKEHPEYKKIRYRLTDQIEHYQGDYLAMWQDLEYLESMLYVK